MGENIKFERTHAPDMYEDDIEYHGYYDTNMVALALIGASVVATIIGVALLLII